MEDLSDSFLAGSQLLPLVHLPKQRFPLLLASCCGQIVTVLPFPKHFRLPFFSLGDSTARSFGCSPCRERDWTRGLNRLRDLGPGVTSPDESTEFLKVSSLSLGLWNWC